MPNWLTRAAARFSTTQRPPGRSRTLRLETLEERSLLDGGALDPTFGVGGKVLTDVGPCCAHVSNLVLQPDGKLIVAGLRTNHEGIRLLLSRYHSDGSLDSGFGDGGIAAPGLQATPHGLLVQADGRIVVLTGDGGVGTLLRLTAAGRTDPTFGSGGQVPVRFEVSQTTTGLTVQPDGKLLAAGHSDGRLAVARFGADGTVDGSFGTGGQAVIDLRLGGGFSARGLVVQPDGRIVVAGDVAPNQGNGLDFAVVRLQANGGLDTAFGTGGLNTTDLGSMLDLATSVSLQRDGRILVAGSTAAGPSGNDLAVVRYNSDGTLDTTFGTGGKVTAGRAGQSETAQGLVVQGDGRIVVAGDTNSGTSRDFVLTRFLPGGGLDPAFGSNGFVVTTFAAHVRVVASALVLQPDGKLVAAGSADEKFALARYAPGSLRVSPNHDFVAQLYADLLGREADPAGMGFWTGRLDQGVPRAAILAGLQESREYRARTVGQAYRALLERPPEAAGLNGWLAFLGQGGTEEQMKAAILGSDEYFQKHGGSARGFVDAVYRDTLHRAPEPAGAQGWIQFLGGAGGNAPVAARREMAARVLQSVEGRTRVVDGLYRHLLRRSADPAGLQHFVAAGVPNWTARNVVVGIGASAEYFAL